MYTTFPRSRFLIFCLNYVFLEINFNSLSHVCRCRMLVEMYKHFGGICYLHFLPKNGDSTFL